MNYEWLRQPSFKAPPLSKTIFVRKTAMARDERGLWLLVPKIF